MSASDRKVVLVTGGSQGLGLGIVRDLIESGYRVGSCSRRPSEAINQLIQEHSATNSFFWQSCTLGEEAEEERYFKEFLAWAGKEHFYGLVNNAGVAKEGILATFPNVESERILNTNLMACLRLCRAALQVFLGKRGPARIINISSIIAIRGYTGLAAYSASKAGLDGLTRALAREVGRRQITINSVNPGYLETDMSASLASDQRQQIIRRTPMGRLGQVSDIVPVVRFMLSADAGFITGQSIVVDGGITS